MRNREFETLKDALYQTVHKSNKSIAVLAEEIGMTANYLYKACMPDSDMDERAAGVRFPTKKVLPLMRATGDFSVLHYMANATEHAVISVPDITNKSCADIQYHAIKSASEFGDLMGVIHDATKDRKITTTEKETIKKEGWEAIEAILTVLKSCE